MSEDQYTGILNAIQQVNADLQEFKHEVNKKFNTVNARISKLNKKVDKIDKKVEDVDKKVDSKFALANERINSLEKVNTAHFGRVSLQVGLFTLFFTAVQFALAYFTK